ncbi:MAG: SUMF1/EgtB/PvdO family nonheme iron enzyme [Deltaproteobacteria bacterium]|nr:SUMF1/EgtB/PvdO family nonheme iron enzyme [Deltaproteobacteria bacterium]
MKPRAPLIFLFLSPAACALPEYGGEGQRCFENKTCLPGLTCAEGNVCAKSVRSDGGVATDVGEPRSDGGATDVASAPDAADAGLPDNGSDVGAVDTGIVFNCGPSLTGKGGDMCDVPAGPFMMGCNIAVDNECYQGTEDPYHQVVVPAFKIDKYEVTASEYKACVTAGVCTAAYTGGDYNYNATGKESHPINGVGWDQAKAYCAWAGKRLPTEAEWEKAARGTDGRKYPWGNTSLDCDHAASDTTCGISGTAPVGSKPDGVSPYGAEDMIGNVWEWVEDWYHDTYTGAPTDGSAWVAPTGTSWVVRGGSWYGGGTFYLRSSFRKDLPKGWWSTVGFRCAAAPCYPNCPTTQMVEIPAGDFWMGCNSSADTECQPNESPYHKVTLSTFAIDKYEVKTGDYISCVDNGVCTAAGTTNLCNFGVAGNENYPINCVNWTQADTYCRWVGARLPTEAEWEKAARGTDGRKYPWGSTPLDCEHAVIRVNGCGAPGTAPVGSKPKGGSPYGVEDMVGNVLEWVNDWYDENYYQNSPVQDPTGPASGQYIVGRGGGYSTLTTDGLRASTRAFAAKYVGYTSHGFRCAKGNGFDWYDPTTDLTWKASPAGIAMDWTAAGNYCTGLGGGWRMPTISELRLLVQGCPSSAAGGACGVTDACSTGSCRTSSCDGCTPGLGPDSGCYWPVVLNGSCAVTVSATEYTVGSKVWAIDFTTGRVDSVLENLIYNVRCVRSGS